MRSGPSSGFTLRLAAIAVLAACGMAAPNAGAGQATDSVSVDLSVLDGPAPGSPSGRIVLTPPAGVQPVTPRATNRREGPSVTLRPPGQSRPAPETPTASRPTPPPARAAAPASPTPLTPAPASPAETETAVATPPSAAQAPAAPAATEAMPPPPRPPAQSAAGTAPAPVGPTPNPMPAGRQAEEEATPPPAETQTASLPDAAALTIAFESGVSDLPAAASQDLRSLAERMAADSSLRVQLMAYASDPENNASRSRRLSLARALTVRTYLIDAGIDSTRIEVRALGDQSDSGNPDRVDAVTATR